MMRVLHVQARSPSRKLTNSSPLLSFSTFEPVIKLDSDSNNAPSSSLASEIVSVLTAAAASGNWKRLLSSSDVPQRLTPDTFTSVLTLTVGHSIHPKLLLDFFYWSSLNLRSSPQSLESFSSMAIVLSNSNLLGPLNGLFENMIKTHQSPPLIFSSVADCFAKCSDSNAAVFDVLVDSFKKMGLLKEAAEVVLLMKGGSLRLPSLRCLNSLLKDLLRSNYMDLFFEVFGAMREVNMGLDVYTCSSLISAYFRAGDAEAAKRVLVEMGEKDLTPNAVIYNTMITGSCRLGALDDAFKLRKEMVVKGLVPDKFTYGALINGLCRVHKSRKAKALLDKMSMGLDPDIVMYSTLIDGFMWEGNIDEALKARDEMVASKTRARCYELWGFKMRSGSKQGN